ncbi:MAG TPA: hypothetical protein VJN96_23770 [Vicinamibacterales bacterium]|nr:hypothetical protein [Vicinamibacterales bacterium]
MRSALLTFCALIIATTIGCTKSAPNAPSATLTISGQPQNQTIDYGASATLSVAASGGGTLSYQWYVGASGATSAPVSGATSASYSTPGLTATTSYWVRVSDGRNQADSASATVTVSAPAAPVITRQPQDVAMQAGDHATLTVEAAGSGLTYQWFEMSNGVEHVIDGATSASYVTPGLTQDVNYKVRVSNAGGSVDSNTVTVSIVTLGS